MARPKTKADPIQVRLSLAADAELRKRAAEKKESPRDWVIRVLERALSKPS